MSRFPFAKSVLGLALALTSISHLQGWAGSACMARFKKREKRETAALARNEFRNAARVSVLKPLHGDEPHLYEALESFCVQDYPDYEIIFALHRADDPARAHIARLRENYPHLKFKESINPAKHGVNGKISNLINVEHLIDGEIAVVSDSDMHVSPQYLKQVVAALKRPNAKLVTTIYAARPASDHPVSLLGGMGINLNFMPGVLLSRLIKRQDCLGATMALSKETLREIGGFRTLVHHVADDAYLGHVIRKAGGNVELAGALTETGVPENKFKDLFLHELRWGRTTRSVAPLAYASGILQFPLFWNAVLFALTCLLTGKTKRAASVFALGWLSRTLMARHLRSHRIRSARERVLTPFLLIPRDLLSGAIVLCSLFGNQVTWKGEIVELASFDEAEKS